MERKIRVGAVSYLNTKPFIFGLQHGPAKDDIELVLDYPARLVSMLKNDEIDIGLVPVGALPSLGEYQIVSDYCIGTDGEVASVAVFSEVPMEEIEAVYLDYQSRTSVLLCRLLFEKHWKKKVEFFEARDEGYLDQIKGRKAGLIIGDRALMSRSRFSYIYDLGLGWKEMTGLPFVFAVWVSLKTFDRSFYASIFKWRQGLRNEIEMTVRYNHHEEYDIEKYFNQNIMFDLTDQMKVAMKHFLLHIKN